MSIKHLKEFNQFYNGFKKRNPYEIEFQQAVYEFSHSIFDFIQENQKYKDLRILERLTEPDRVISFRVFLVR